MVFPAESVRREGGHLTHPDGRIQRLRQALGHAGEVRPGWHVLGRALRAPRRRRRPRSRSPAGDRRGGRGRALLRRPDARGDRRPRRALAGARGGLRAARRGACRATPLPEPPGRARGAPRSPRRPRSGPAARSSTRLRSPSWPPTRTCRALAGGRARAGHRERRRDRAHGGGRAGHGHGRACAPACPPAACSSARRATLPDGPSRSRPRASGAAVASDGERARDGREVDRDLRLHPPDRAADPAARAQAARPLPVADRPEPRGPEGPACSRSPTCSSCSRRRPSTPATAVPWMMAIAPVISIVTAVATLAIVPFGPYDAWGGNFGLYGMDVSIGLLYFFAFGSLGVLRAGARRLGLRLQVLVPRRHARRRAADLLRGGARPVAARRGDDGRLALAGGHRRGAGRHVVRGAPVRGLLHLHGGRLRRDRARRRSTCPRATPRSWAATTRSTAGCASARSSWPSTSR